MPDRLDDLRYYQISLQLWDEMWNDTETMMRDVRGKEITKQLARSVGSICANIEEGYGRGFGKEYVQFLRYSRGSARESKGWYYRARKLLDPKVQMAREKALDQIIAMISKAIQTLEQKRRDNI
ncbi:MAG: four helix bundle protein [Planctomycetes bacterium]|nr:four helix bundle protein [Planctomycetota bacterium]